MTETIARAIMPASPVLGVGAGLDSSSDSVWMKDVIQNQAAALNRLTAKIESIEKEKGSHPAIKDAHSVFVPSQIK